MDPTGRDDLMTLLARYPAIARPYRKPEALGNAGGYSGARLWRYESGRGWLVARAWPQGGPSHAGLEQIHRWLDETAGLGFVPIPLPALDGRTVHEQGGRLWDVSPWLEGAAAPERPPLRPRLRSGFAALAAFHQALRREQTRGPSPGISARLRELEGLLHGGFDAMEHALDRAAADPRCAAARHWLSLARATGGRLVEPLRRASGQVVPLQPCLRDARPEHLLFSGDHVSGLIDFGAMAIESVAADLARLLGEWVGPDTQTRAEALDAYASVRPLDAAEITLLDVFEDSSALLGAGHWVRWHFLEGRRFDDPSAVVAGIDRGLQRLVWRALTWEGVGRC